MSDKSHGAPSLPWHVRLKCLVKLAFHAVVKHNQGNDGACSICFHSVITSSRRYSSQNTTLDMTSALYP